MIFLMCEGAKIRKLSAFKSVQVLRQLEALIEFYIDGKNAKIFPSSCFNNVF